MIPEVIRFQEKLRLFSAHWQPKIIAQMNEYHFKLAKVQGEFVWHSHPETDEVFIVLEGSLEIELREGTLSLSRGEMVVLPRGVEHKPRAAQECSILLIEPVGTRNTGDAGGEMTAPGDTWI